MSTDPNLSPKQQCKVCLIQVGARLHYAAPAALARANALRALVTDANEKNFGSIKHRLEVFAPKSFARLNGRTIPPEVPQECVHSSLWPTIELSLAAKAGPRLGQSARTQHWLGIGGHRLAKIAIKENFFGADTLYVHPCVTTDAVQEARRRGMRVVIEAVSHPFNKRVELAEFARYRVPSDQSEAQVEDNIDFFREEAKEADVVLAASPYVHDGLVELGVPPERIAIVRYGLDDRFFTDLKVKPVPGRVLYVGAVNYLKGVPTLAAAAQLLTKDKIEVLVAGPCSSGMAGRAEFYGPRYLGQVPRSAIRHHFAEADVFAFPTLSDGFGLVLLEAMAAGLPVVSTRNCADLVRDGENGFLVPDRDPEALAEAVRTIVRNRELRERFSRAARETASHHTLSEYSRSLARAVTGVVSDCKPPVYLPTERLPNFDPAAAES